MTIINKVNSLIPKTICLLFIAVFLLFPITINEINNSSIQHTDETTTGNKILSKLSSLTSSDPITISGDTDFATQASLNSWPGNGSSTNPYIIQNLQIINNTNSSQGISISGVTKYFIIRNNYIEMTGLNTYGIYLYQTSNVGTIYNNTLYNNTQYGVYLYYSHNTTVSNNYFSYNKQAGLHTFYTNSTTITYNTFDSNNDGIYLRRSSHNLVMHNTISNNTEGIFHQADTNYNTYYNNTFKDNTYNIHTQPAFDYNNISYNIFDNSSSNIYFSGTVNHNIIAHNNFTNGGGIRFASTTPKPVNNSLYDNLFINNSYGIWSDLTNSKVYNNTFINNGYGIQAISSQNGSFWDNYFKDNNYAIFISSSHNGTYINNTLIDNNYAFQIISGKNNTIDYNYIYNSTYGINFSSAYNNTLINNNILDNYYGIKFFASYNNTFYGNNFLHNTLQISGGDASNKADNGTFGNFWLSYMSTAVDSNSDGIGDVPYTIGSITDNFPLMIWYNVSLPLEIVNANGDVSYNEGDPAFNITWRAIDESPAQYVVYENGTPIKSGSWSSFETVFVTLSGLMLGSYNYTIMYNDTDSNVKIDTVIVTVYDVTPPTIVGIPSYIYMEDTTGHSLSWNVTDNHPDKYYILKDGVNVQNGTWVANSNITIAIDGLLKNTYIYKLYVNDTSNNIQSFTTTVIVYDGTPPNVTDYGNQTVEAGSTNQNVNWNATDRYPAYYELYRDGVLIATNPWSSSTNISDLIDTSTLGLYNYSIIVFDQSGNNMTDTIFINIVDTTNPLILTNPTTNISFYSGIFGNDLTWTVYDLYPANYSILLNSSVYQNGDWTNNVTTNVDSLAIGYYNLTIVFRDTSGNIDNQTYWITVLRDDIPPVIVQQPTNTSYQDITTNNVISWTAIDTIKAGNYTVYIDSVPITTADWINNTAVPVNIDYLSVGLHNVTIVFRDGENNSITDTIWVTVFTDTKSPVFVGQPSNVSYLLGSTGYNASWTVIDDLGPANFTLYSNGVFVVTSSWYNNTAITILLDGFPVGVYNFTIVFNDTTGNSVSDTIWLTVFIDTTSPNILQRPSNVSYLLGSTGYNLSWTVIDKTGSANYTLYQNGTIVGTGYWINNTALTISIDGLPVGVYNLTIVFNNTAGYTKNDTVWITVFADTTSPTILQQPLNVTYQQGDTGYNLSWTVIDDIGPANYSLYIDNVFSTANSWQNSTKVTINIDGLSAGVHKFVIYFNDTTGNVISDTVYVTVWKDTNAPIILQRPGNIAYIEGQTTNITKWIAIDDHAPGTYTLLRNGTPFKTGSWSNDTLLSISVDGLSIGSYNFTMVFKDQSNNSVTYSFWVIVSPTPVSTTQPSTTTTTITTTTQTTTSSQPTSTTPTDSSSTSQKSNTSTTTTVITTHVASLNILFILGSLAFLMIRRRRK